MYSDRLKGTSENLDTPKPCFNACGSIRCKEALQAISSEDELHASQKPETSLPYEKLNLKTLNYLFGAEEISEVPKTLNLKLRATHPKPRRRDLRSSTSSWRCWEAGTLPGLSRLVVRVLEYRG